jgi:flagella basal body P-ring formation protein FlgA
MKNSRQIFILILLFISTKSFSIPVEFNLGSQLVDFLKIQQSEIAEKGFRSDFDIGNIDPRFNEKSCTTPLSFSLNRSPLTQTNLTVLAECKDATPWKIYITTKFNVYGYVVYASTTLPRSHTIQRDDIEVKEEIINKSYYASFSDVNDVIGMIAKRSIRHGSVIQANLLQAPKLVKRGDDVVIMASAQGIMIKMRGTAMQDGELGQQISVKNSQSERIVKARVSDSGLVSVTL